MPVLIKCTSGCLCSSISNILRLEGMKELSLSLSNENNHFTLFIPVNSAFSSIPRARADTLFANSTLFQNVRDMLYYRGFINIGIIPVVVDFVVELIDEIFLKLQFLIMYRYCIERNFVQDFTHPYNFGFKVLIMFSIDNISKSIFRHKFE